MLASCAVGGIVPHADFQGSGLPVAVVNGVLDCRFSLFGRKR